MNIFTHDETDQIVKMLQESTMSNLATEILGSKLVPWTRLKEVRRAVKKANHRNCSEATIRALKQQTKRSMQSMAMAFRKNKGKEHILM